MHAQGVAGCFVAEQLQLGAPVAAHSSRHLMVLARWRRKAVVSYVRGLQNEFLLLRIHRPFHVEGGFWHLVLVSLLHDSIIVSHRAAALALFQHEFKQFNEVVRALRFVLHEKLLELNHDPESAWRDDECRAVQVIRVGARKSGTRYNRSRLIERQMNRFVAIFHDDAVGGRCNEEKVS